MKQVRQVVPKPRPVPRGCPGTTRPLKGAVHWGLARILPAGGDPMPPFVAIVLPACRRSRSGPEFEVQRSRRMGYVLDCVPRSANRALLSWSERSAGLRPRAHVRGELVNATPGSAAPDAGRAFRVLDTSLSRPGCSAEEFVYSRAAGRAQNMKSTVYAVAGMDGR
jgi:hypothetical protein